MENSQDAASHIQKALKHHFLLIKGHSYDTLNAFCCHVFSKRISEVTPTLPNYFWQLSPFSLCLVIEHKKSNL